MTNNHNKVEGVSKGQEQNYQGTKVGARELFADFPRFCSKHDVLLI